MQTKVHNGKTWMLVLVIEERQGQTEDVVSYDLKVGMGPGKESYLLSNLAKAFVGLHFQK